MQLTDYPSIVTYRHHFMAIYYSRDNLALDAAGFSIEKTVPVNHSELPVLFEAGKQRREELTGIPNWNRKQAIQDQVQELTEDQEKTS